MSENTKNTPANPFDNTLLICLDIYKIGDRKSVSEEIMEESVDVDTDKSLVTMNKKILECPEYEALKTHKTETVKWVRSKALPTKFLKGGIYPLVLDLIPAADAYLEKRKQEYLELVEKFIAVYPQRIKENCERLKVLGCEKDYASIDKVRSACTFDWEYLAAGQVPEKVKNVSSAIYDRERRKKMEEMKTQAEEVKVAMRTMFEQLVEGMTEALTPKEDGKKKKFYESNVTKLKEYIDTFSGKNIVGDAELEQLVSQSKLILSGVDVKALRKDDDARLSVKTRMDAIKTSLKSMTGTAPKRSIAAPDDDVAVPEPVVVPAPAPAPTPAAVPAVSVPVQQDLLSTGGV